MPGGRTHRGTGAVAGAAFSFYKAQGQTDLERLAESIGGAVGGVLGGMLPDVLEPALSPNHRGFAHSVLVGCGVISAQLDEWSAQCRAKAEHFHNQRLAENDQAKRLLLMLVEMSCRLAAGFLTGVQAGYASHLALDALTPRSLPLVV